MTTEQNWPKTAITSWHIAPLNVGNYWSERIMLDKYLRQSPQLAFCWRQTIHFKDLFLLILGRIKKRHISVRVSGKQTAWRNRNPSTVKLTFHKDHNGPTRMLKIFGDGFRVVALPSPELWSLLWELKALAGDEVGSAQFTDFRYFAQPQKSRQRARLSIRGADYKDGSSWKRMEWSTLNLYMIVSCEVGKQSRQ